MKSLILKFLLCPDLYLSKTSQLTLIFKKRSFVKKNVHSTYVCMNPFHQYYEIEKNVVLCATCASQQKKGNLALSSKKEDAFLSTGCSNWKKALEKL